MAEETEDDSTSSSDQSNASKRKKALDEFGKSAKQIAQARQDATDRLLAENPGMPTYRKGGKVRRTGLALVHKGERVLNTKQEKEREMKKKMEPEKGEDRMEEMRKKKGGRKGGKKMKGRKGGSRC